MSKKINKNGIRIANIEGSEIIKNINDNKRVNIKYNGVFSYSLLSLKLMELGVKVSVNNTTDDIICIRFGYGYGDTKNTKEYLSVEQIREKLYLKGFTIQKRIHTTLKASKKDNQKITIVGDEYVLVNKDGEIISTEKIKYKDIKYKVWFRTPSKARVGDVFFINEDLLPHIRKWQRMGMEFVDNEECKLVELLAYESLTASAIVDTLEIKPSEILVLNDLDSYFNINCADVVLNNKEGVNFCDVIPGEKEIKNTLFDGQALLEDSLFVSTNAGIKLLRQHMFKACGFRTYIQVFFKDYCEKNNLDYETFTVKDRYGNKVLAKNVKLITTENAMKWEKFFANKAEGFKVWSRAVEEDKCTFGVCKEDHPSKYGDMQRTSYQHINTLCMEKTEESKNEIKEIAKYSIDFVNNLKASDEEFIGYLESMQKSNNKIQLGAMLNANAFILDIYKKNNNFVKSKFFRRFKAEIISKLVGNMRAGKLFVEGDNLTVVGNPYTMLLHSVGALNEYIKGNKIEGYADETLDISKEYISVYTKRFIDNEYLAAFRNPHNAPNNIAYFKNNKSELMDRYFNFSSNIIAINMVETEIQDLANSMDQDSDFMLVTNNKIMVKKAKEVFRNELYPCIVNSLKTSNKTYNYNLNGWVDIDNTLARAKDEIGLTSNLAQLANSFYWNSNKDKELSNIVVICSVLAQVAIDNAKRNYEIDIVEERKRISKLEKMNPEVEFEDRKYKAKPSFWKHISGEKILDRNIDKSIKCPMVYLDEIIEKEIGKASSHQEDDNKFFLADIKGRAKGKQMEKIEEMIRDYDKKVKEYTIDDKKDKRGDVDKKSNFYKWNEMLFNDTIEKIAKMKIEPKTMLKLISNALLEDGSNKKYCRKMLNTLYTTHKTLFLSCFKEAEEEIYAVKKDLIKKAKENNLTVARDLKVKEIEEKENRTLEWKERGEIYRELEKEVNKVIVKDSEILDVIMPKIEEKK